MTFKTTFKKCTSYYKKKFHTPVKVCCKTMVTASNLQLLAARSPLSCWMLLSFLPASVALAGTTSGGPLPWLDWDAWCWGGCWRELALVLFLSTVKEHVLSVVTTLIIIIPPSIAAAAGLAAVPPPYRLLSGSQLKIGPVSKPSIFLQSRTVLSNQPVWWFPVLLLWQPRHKNVSAECN